jgi:shikimate kinase
MGITLVGYRGSGKSTVAPLLAARLGRPWVDSDREVEAAAGMSIRQIFETEGEAGFRRREKSALAALLARGDLVIAAGGGAVLDAQTRRAMRQAGVVIWLNADPKTLAGRIAADPGTNDNRPNLAGGGLEEIQALRAAREPLYREVAALVIDTAPLTPAEVVDRIEQWLARDARPGLA